MQNFHEVYLYTNQSLLKDYLINNEITPISDSCRSAFALSNQIAGGVLYFNISKAVSADYFSTHYKGDSYETAVALKVLLSDEYSCVIYDDKGDVFQGKISDYPNAVAFYLKDGVSFSNVVSIMPIEKQLKFLQGDSTLLVPTHLIEKENYSPKMTTSDEVVDVIVSDGTNDEFHDDFVFTDDLEEFDFDNISFENSENVNVDDNRKANIKNSLLAGYTMLLQGNRPLDGKLNTNLYCLLGGEGSFDEYISETIYPDAPCNISHCNNEPSKLLFDYYNTYKGVASESKNTGELYSEVISLLLEQNIDSNDDFKTLLLNKIFDPDERQHVYDCLSDLRARDRIAALKANNDTVLPIYFLYVFFDYGFDRFNENIIEFGLEGSEYVPVLLSLWGLKNGMQGIYEEFKNPEVLYACESQIEDWLGIGKRIIPIDKFYETHDIKLEPDETIVGNYRCSYVDTNVEYLYCVGKDTDKKIHSNIIKLKNLLSKTFPFQYVALKDALDAYDPMADNSKYADQIHKQYLALQNKPKKKTNRKREIPDETTDEEPMNLFNIHLEDGVR